MTDQTGSDQQSDIDEVKEIAADLRSVLPTRIEAAVSRALDAHEGGGVDHRVAELHALAADTAQRTRYPVNHRAGNQRFPDARLRRPTRAILEKIPDRRGQVVIGVHQTG